MQAVEQFSHSVLPPAARGTPQIEVTFDIDANGILHVGAKDKATGKENKITIKANSGLTEDEIQRMVKDAELNAEDDKKKRELVDAKNSAEGQIHMVRNELDAREITDEVKSAVESAIKEVEVAIDSDDKEKITQSLSDLMVAAKPVFEANAKTEEAHTVEAEVV